MKTLSFAHRILCKIPAFHASNKQDLDEALGPLIGIYKNGVPASSDVAFFLLGMALNDGAHAIRIPYANIIDVFTSQEDFVGILALMKDGSSIKIPISGRRGRFFDCFEVQRFLDRVLQDKPIQH